MPEYISAGDLALLGQEDVKTGAEAFDGTGFSQEDIETGAEAFGLTGLGQEDIETGAEAFGLTGFGQDEGVPPWTRTPLYALEGMGQVSVGPAIRELEKMATERAEMSRGVAQRSEAIRKAMMKPEARSAFIRLLIKNREKLSGVFSTMAGFGEVIFPSGIETNENVIRDKYLAGRITADQLSQQLTDLHFPYQDAAIKQEIENKWTWAKAASAYVQDKIIGEGQTKAQFVTAITQRLRTVGLKRRGQIRADAEAQMGVITRAEAEARKQRIAETATVVKEGSVEREEATFESTGVFLDTLKKKLKERLSLFGKYGKWIVIGGLGLGGLIVFSQIRSLIPKRR